MTNTETGRDLLIRWLGLLDDRALDAVMPTSRITLDTRDYLEALGSFDANEGQENPYDWPEDFKEENGNYTCQCLDCGRFFIGHKRRMQCKECANKPAPPAPSPKDAREGRHEPEGSGKKARTIKRMGS